MRVGCKNTTFDKFHHFLRQVKGIFASFLLSKYPSYIKEKSEKNTQSVSKIVPRSLAFWLQKMQWNQVLKSQQKSSVWNYHLNYQQMIQNSMALHLWSVSSSWWHLFHLESQKFLLEDDILSWQPNPHQQQLLIRYLVPILQFYQSCSQPNRCHWQRHSMHLVKSTSPVKQKEFIRCYSYSFKVWQSIWNKPLRLCSVWWKQGRNRIIHSFHFFIFNP